MTEEQKLSTLCGLVSAYLYGKLKVALQRERI